MRLQRIRDVSLSSVCRQVIRRAIDIATVPAPTGDQPQRFRFVKQLFATIGLETRTDYIGDVVARVPGRDRSKTVLLAAHLDTVFPRSTAIRISEESGRIAAPGIGDNSLGVSCVSSVPEILAELGETPAVDLLLTGNVGEEGLGNLRGMRSVMDAFPDVGAVVAVEGHNLGRVTHVAVGSRRLRIRVTGQGGHSWGDFGNASAIHAAAEIIHELAKIPLPASPKTTLNVGMIQGGISINTIAPEAVFDLDMRSIEEYSLRRLADRAERVIRTARPRVSVEIEVIGERPAGFVSPESKIVRRAVSVLELLGIQPAGDVLVDRCQHPNWPRCSGCLRRTHQRWQRSSGGRVHRNLACFDWFGTIDGTRPAPSRGCRGRVDRLLVRRLRDRQWWRSHCDATD